MSELEDLLSKIKGLENELAQKNEQIRILESHLSNENKINHFNSEENNDIDEDDLDSKITKFLKVFQVKKNQSIGIRDLYLLITNALSVLYHFENDKNIEFEPTIIINEKDSSDLNKLTYSYCVEFFRQLLFQSTQNNLEHYKAKINSFPIAWLLGLFPYNVSPSNKDISHETIFLPLHLFLAIDYHQLNIENENDVKQDLGLNLEDYLTKLDLFLEKFGETAFQEDVSPLSIAVAKPFPNIQIIDKIVSFRPNSINQEDEDGCIPLMHACSCNANIEVINYLYQRCKSTIEHADNFGCSAIHYATFSGTKLAVEYLIQQQPNCVEWVEDNGALPLHDAVQNTRGFQNQYELSQLLLQHYPQGIFKKDNFGAFPLHKAAKSSNLEVVTLLYQSFPNAVFAADNEGLLPLHYYSQREDKNEHLDLVQFLLEKNSTCKVLSEKELFAKEKAQNQWMENIGKRFFSRQNKQQEQASIPSVLQSNKNMTKRKSTVVRRTSIIPSK